VRKEAGGRERGRCGTSYYTHSYSNSPYFSPLYCIANALLLARRFVHDIHLHICAMVNLGVWLLNSNAPPPPTAKSQWYTLVIGISVMER
jgi:hypothetical protein